MMRYLSLLLLVISSCIYSHVDFDTSMQLSLHQKVVHTYYFSAQAYEAFRSVYNQYDPAYMKMAPHLKIPKIIHQIWLGGALPQEYVPLRATWHKHHPEWIFVFWTDNPLNYQQGSVVVTTFAELSYHLQSDTTHKHIVVDVSKLQFDNRMFYDRALNYGEKSDILKWEIIYRFGGLYVDTDFECLKPLDELHYMYDFYTGIQPLDTHLVQLGAALYAAWPYHPILHACVAGIKDNQHIPQIVIKTGPIHFTRSFFNVVGTTSTHDIALPASYFYPCSYEQKGLPASVWQKPESYAIHHWAGSWLKPEAYEKRYSI